MQVYEKCRNQWGYRIPEGEYAQNDLRQLCQQTLGFENHFLTIYKAYLLERLRDPDPEIQLHAAKQLRQIMYADPEITAALIELKTHQ